MNNKKQLLTILSVTILLLGGSFGAICYYHHIRSQKHICRRPIPNVTYDGIDVSHHQGNLDWERLSKDDKIQFAYVKATEGSTWTDKNFRQNITEARKHGIKVGAYHLLSLTTSPETQVANFCKMVSPNDVDLIPAIDIEAKLMHHKNRGRLKEYVEKIDKLLRTRFGRKPLIYTSTRVYNQYLYPEFENHYLWISSYSRRCPLLRGASHTNIWQYSENRKVENYHKIIDLNCFVNGMTIDKLELR